MILNRPGGLCGVCVCGGGRGRVCVWDVGGGGGGRVQPRQEQGSIVSLGDFEGNPNYHFVF